MLKQQEISVDAKSGLEMGSNSMECENLNERMQETLEDYTLSLHGISEGSKENYISQVKTFGRFLMSRGVKRYEDAETKDIDIFLSNYQKDSTKNVYIVRFKHFYGTFLKLPNLVKHLKFANNELQPVTPSELLTLDECMHAVNTLEGRVEELESQMLPQGFVRAPAYDSGWIFSDAHAKTLYHNLGTDKVFVYLIGRNSLSEPITGKTQSGTQHAMCWSNLNTTHIDVYGRYGCKYVRVMIWRIQEPPT